MVRTHTTHQPPEGRAGYLAQRAVRSQPISQSGRGNVGRGGLGLRQVELGAAGRE